MIPVIIFRVSTKKFPRLRQLATAVPKDQAISVTAAVRGLQVGCDHPSDLDCLCRELLLRAQRAIAAVLGSEVYASDMLDHAAGEMVLRWHEWDIAAALRVITRLRAELAASAAAGGAGPMAAAVLDSQQRAITLARDATEARVGALESYAVQVQAADEAQQDWLSALRLSALNSQYLDLVARTAAGGHALAEITGLTEQAVTAAEVFRGSLHQAALAAEALALPAAPATPGE